MFEEFDYSHDFLSFLPCQEHPTDMMVMEAPSGPNTPTKVEELKQTTLWGTLWKEYGVFCACSTSVEHTTLFKTLDCLSSGPFV